jgi:hypothetical protein
MYDETGIKKIEQRRNAIAGSDEWQNFTTTVDDVRWLFSPDSAQLRQQVVKGTKLNQRRVSVVGTLFLDNYANGIVSETVTHGSDWFGAEDEHKIDEDAEMFTDISKIMRNRINHSNFYSQFFKDQRGAGLDGTSCFYVERINGQLNHVCVPFGSFWFAQNYQGVPDIVWIERKTSAGALSRQFGEDKVSQKVRDAVKTNPEMEVCIIHYCGPRGERDTAKRDNKNKAYELLTYEKDSCYLLEEGGTDIQKFMVYRVKQILNESLGRGPCLDTASAMSAIERASKEYERCARLAGVPILGIGASMGQNGFRWSNQENASLLIYNDTGISGPPQALNPKSNPEFILQYIELQTDQMRRMFYLDYFNPVVDKKNITAYQTREIVGKAQQMVDQLTGPLIQERLDPYLRWVFLLLGEAGEFKKYGSWPEIQEAMSGGRVNFVYKSKLTNSQKRIKLMAEMEYAEYAGQIGKMIPDSVMQYSFMARTNWAALPEKIREGVNASPDILVSERKAKEATEAFKEQMDKQMQDQRTMAMAEAAAKGNKAPEPGSMTEQLMYGG